MDLASAKALKDELMSGLYGEALGETKNLGLRVQGLEVREESEQAGIGFSRRSSSKDFQVEIRLRRSSGRAFQLAKTLQSKSPQEVSVALIQRLDIPAPEALAQAASTNRDMAKFADLRRPLHLGLSVGHVDGGSGSIGAFVRANRNCKGFPKGGDAILSACHVLALRSNGAFVEDAPIYQPGRPDLDAITGTHRVATMVNHYTTFSELGANYVDAAYAMITAEAASHLLPDSNPNHIPSGMDLPVSGAIDPELLSADED